MNEILGAPESIAVNPCYVSIPGNGRPSADDADAAWVGRIEAACDSACAAIAPSWPLDRSIAVNPHWGRISRPVREVAARMGVLAGIRVFPSRTEMRRAWEQGRITAADLDQALRLVPAAQAVRLSTVQCIEALSVEPRVHRLPLLIDVLDDDPRRQSRLSWRQAITHQVSQTCASFFDEHQADWQPARGGSLYAFWRDTLAHDHGIGILMGLSDLSKRLHALPTTAAEAERWVLQCLDLPEVIWQDYLEAALLTVNGWASWCAYLGWQARQEGRSDPHLRDLLAIRLAWGAIVLESRDDAAARQAFSALKAEWEMAPQRLKQAEEALLVDEVWQSALEIGYQRQLVQRLSWVSPSKGAVDQAAGVEVQAVFCIDVRSEPLRRALEATWPAIQTIGFAGFFGLPLAYTPLGTTARRPQLPGLLAPAVDASDRLDVGSEQAPDDEKTLQHAAIEARRRRFAWSEQWSAGSRWPQAAFSFVEAAGMGYIGKLSRWLWPSAGPRGQDDLEGLPARYRRVCRPALHDLDVEAKVSLAGPVLHAMGLDRHQAPLVLLVGHGSQSENNAHAAALDCGACCGQTGEVNARVLAELLNDRAVRAGLRERGITIADQTTFVAALHNTTTDEVEGFDLDLMPAWTREGWARLQAVFAQAGDQVRRERAVRLGLDPRAGHSQLLTAFRRRANDGAQTRPEWGLAGNASFVIAPRHRTSGVVLDGRGFLHDYDATSDKDGSILELLMTAPMVVTHWINWQYHASTCDPARLGSGNKVLHNVVGGRIGVFEGNGGDLRIGLSRQSLNDGVRWLHEPLRLTVVIDAPVKAIERVIGRHDMLQQLLDNGWVHLLAIEGDEPVFLRRRYGGGWERAC
jgi:uncharacterized protein YbcC (UPF0753/DUF2309 family)